MDRGINIIILLLNQILYNIKNYIADYSFNMVEKLKCFSCQSIILLPCYITFSLNSHVELGAGPTFKSEIQMPTLLTEDKFRKEKLSILSCS